MGLKIKIYLTDDEDCKYMGIGVLWLLEEIGRTGSLRMAANNLDIAYSKGYSMITRAEENLGRPLIVRKKGGRMREGSSLTPFARSFIVLYRDFQQEVKDRAEEPYARFNEALDKLMKESDDNGGSSV